MEVERGADADEQRRRQARAHLVASTAPAWAGRCRPTRRRRRTRRSLRPPARSSSAVERPERRRVAARDGQPGKPLAQARLRAARAPRACARRTGRWGCPLTGRARAEAPPSGRGRRRASPPGARARAAPTRAAGRRARRASRADGRHVVGFLARAHHEVHRGGRDVAAARPRAIIAVHPVDDLARSR